MSENNADLFVIIFFWKFEIPCLLLYEVICVAPFLKKIKTIT